MRKPKSATPHADATSCIHSGEEHEEPSANFSDQEQRLIASRILTPPRRRRADTLPEPQGYVRDEVMREVWRRERKGR